MQNCDIALDHLDYRSDLDTRWKLSSVISIPVTESLAEEAEAKGRGNRKTTFQDLTD